MAQYQLVKFTLNGKPVEQMIDVRASLTDLLRNDFRLTSVKKGCEVGEDPLTVLKKYVDRVGHVHLKDMRADVVAKVRPEGWSFLTAVRNGAFTVPGDGCVNYDPIFKLLSEARYEGWLLVEAEQDPAMANPLEYAIKACKYIREHTGL